MKFDLPAQPAPAALLKFSKQAGVEVLFSHNDIKDITTNAVQGEMLPDAALKRLLDGTGLTATPNGDAKFMVARASLKPGSVSGSLMPSRGGGSMVGVTVTVYETGDKVSVSERGLFKFPALPPGTYTLVASGEGFSRLKITDVVVRSGTDTTLGTQEMPVLIKDGEVQMMKEVVVSAKKDIETLAAVEVSADKITPFSTRNVDIPRGINDVQPYFMIDAKTIERSGANTVEGFLRQRLTMSTTSFTMDQSFAFGGTASQTINLRGLGAGQTLVLLNGRRMGSGNLSFAGTQTSINTVPLGAIDRIEVLPTSASAIYASNAVGGVINIILKRHYSGGEVRTTYQNTMDTDAPIRSADLNYGFTLEGGKTQVMLMASWSGQKSLFYQDRSVMKEYDLRHFLNNGINTGNIVQAGVPIIRGTANLVLKPAFGGATLGSRLTYIPLGITPTTSAATLAAALIANDGQFPDPRLIPASNSRSIRGGMLADINTPTELRNVGLTFRRELTSKLEFNAEFSLNRLSTARNMAAGGSATVPATAPSNPFTTAVTVIFPWNGEAPQRSNADTRRVTAGLAHKLPHDWKALFDYTWNQTANSQDGAAAGGFVFATADVTRAFNDGTLNPFLDTTRYPVDYLKYGGLQTWTGDGGSSEFAFRASGPLGRLPGGAPLLTFGAVLRQEGFGDGNSYIVFGDFPSKVTANMQTTALGKRQTTKSAYAELQIPIVSESNRLPLVREFNVQLASRREDFLVRTGTSQITILPVPATPPVILSSEADYTSTNPTAGFSYRPVKDVMFRASYGKGFVAPTYAQLMLNPTPSAFPTTIGDPQRGGQSYTITTFGSGNPDLTPETSKSLNIGVVYEPQSGPLKGLRANVEYSVIRKQNNIGSLTAQQFIDQESAYAGRITRAAPVAGDTFTVGRISTINIMQLNLLKSMIETFDVTLSYRQDTGRYGAFDFTALGTFTNHFTRKTSFTTPNLDFAGYTSAGAPKFQGNGTLTWDYRNWTAVWSTRFIPRLKVFGPPLSTSLATVVSQGGPEVANQTYSDLFVTYRFQPRASGAARWSDRYLRGTELQVGIINVFNKTPPYDVASFGSYYYSTWGNIRLQEYRISIKKPL